MFSMEDSVSDNNQKNSTTPAASTLPKLLVVDDDEAIVKQMRWGLSEEYTVFTAGSRQAALEIFQREAISVAILDLGLPPHPRDAIEGLRTIDELLTRDRTVKIIIISGNSDRQNALRALEKGAMDVFAKPVNLDELKMVLQRACRRAEMEKEQLLESASKDQSFENMIGSSAAMQNVFGTIGKVAETDLPVLILGESGTGKELVANAIHNRSPWRNGPFVAINCGAIPETLLESELFGNEKGAFTGATTHRKGKFEYAQGGTLFLDEIGDLAQPLQVKILRFLQEKVIERVGGREPIPVQCRVIAATHRDLDAAVKDHRFREDLYFRLAVIKVTLPPLRQRTNDVIALAEYFIELFSKELKKTPKKLSESAVAAIRKHTWPGNVRELQNRIKCALVLADSPFINPTDLELETPVLVTPRSSSTLREAVQELEREMVVTKLRENNGNISKTARMLGISRPTLYELIARYGIEYA
jgi:two-component system, NtrC family, response regulator